MALDREAEPGGKAAGTEDPGFGIGPAPSRPKTAAAQPSTAAPASAEGPQWYIAQPGGEQEGPFPLAILKARASSGQLSPDDLVWTQGRKSWAPAREVLDVFSPSAGAAAPAIPIANSVAAIGQLGGRVFPWLSTPAFIRTAARVSGLLGAVILLLSILLWFFGYSWFSSAVLFAVLFVLGEGLASILETLLRIEKQLSKETRQ
jgi:hypothetical protein